MVWGVGRVGAKHSRKRGSGSQRRHVPLESGCRGTLSGDECQQDVRKLVLSTGLGFMVC
jgi:hypothetical protein